MVTWLQVRGLDFLSLTPHEGRILNQRRLKPRWPARVKLKLAQNVTVLVVVPKLATSAEEVTLSQVLAEVSLALPGLGSTDGVAVSDDVLLVHLQQRVGDKLTASKSKELLKVLSLVGTKLIHKVLVRKIVLGDSPTALFYP